MVLGNTTNQQAYAMSRGTELNSEKKKKKKKKKKKEYVYIIKPR